MPLVDDETIPVGQRERLTVRLRSLIRQYPRGPGIIKEFIQNADDAGSDWVRVVMDWREHGAGLTEEQSLVDILGPALLIANGSVFTDSNFDAIQKIGESDKLLAAAKTGRFGLGFNTSYNVTDFPSLVSQDLMICFDPHEGPVASKGSTGLGLRLGVLRRRFPAWHAAFSAGGLTSNAESHAGTIFRLPLRSAQRAAKSEISHESFDESDFDAIVKQLVADGPTMLLFTRNVLHLTVEEIPKEGGRPRTILDIRTQNPHEVTASRRSVQLSPDIKLPELLAELEAGQIRSTKHRHKMEVSTATGKQPTEWHIHQGFYPDANGELVRHARRMVEFEERAIPEVGVAIRLERGKSDSPVASECEGLFCCGLPLPARTGLPVHINGCFDLDDSRTRLTVVGALSDSGKARAEWNELLLRLAVSRCYGDAVEGLADIAQEADPKAFYLLWPDEAQATNDVMRRAVAAIYAELAKRQIFRCATANGYVRASLPDADIAPDDAEPKLLEALLAQDFWLPEPPLPRAILNSSEAAGIELQRITPALIHATIKVATHSDCRLKDAPFPALRRRDWLEAITRFILRDKAVDLNGLPLALLLNGNLAAFGLPKPGGRFSGDDDQRKIFRSYPHWFIDPEYITVTGLVPQPAAQFHELTPKSAVLLLKHPLPKVAELGEASWDIEGKAPPNAAWLTLVLEYLASNASHFGRDDLKEYPLVPDQMGKLHTLYGAGTPLFRPKSRKLANALELLPLPLVTGSSRLLAAAESFAGSLSPPGLWIADSVDLLDTLHAYADEWQDLHQSHNANIHDPILDALSEERCVEAIDDDRQEKLRELRIFPTVDGRVVDAGEPDFYLPTGEQPPAVSGPIHLALLGAGDRWRPLLEKAGIPRLDLPTLISEVLVPAFALEEPARQIEVLKYIRTNLDRALDQEDASGRGKTLLQKLGGEKLILGSDGQLHKAATLFAPDVLGVRDILGDRAIFPDFDAYPAPRSAWFNFFRALGMKEKIEATDLVDRIDEVTRVGHGPHERRQIGVIFGYIQKHWDEIKGQRVLPADGPSGKLPDVLKVRQWLPAATNAAFPGFKPPENRFFKPGELYTLARGHLVAGEAPLLAGQNPSNEILTALGIPTSPGLDVVLRRFDRLIELSTQPAGETVSPDELKKSFDEIYRFLGRPAGPTAVALKSRETLRSLYKDRKCIWDHARRRLVRPRDSFAEPVAFFEPYKVRVVGESQVAAGLDLLGRRASADGSDFRDFLEILLSQKGASPCDDAEQRQALYALNRIGNEPDADLVNDTLPILTQSGRLLPLSDVFRKDNAAWASRITNSELEFAHAGISGPRILAELPRLSESVEEVLDEEPLPSADRELQALCRRLEGLIRSAEFARGLVRLVSHDQDYPVRNFHPQVAGLQVCPAVSIRTRLVLIGSEGDLSIGDGEVDLFVDKVEGRIWIATRSIRSVRPKLAKAMNQFLGDFGLRDLAPLEAVLGSSREEIEAVLDEREIMRLNPEQPEVDNWPGEPGDAAGAASDKPGAEPPDEGDGQDTEEGDSGEPVPGPRAQDRSGSDRDQATPEHAPEDPRPATKPLRPHAAHNDHLLGGGSNDAPPVAPGTGRSQEAAARTSAARRDEASTKAELGAPPSQQPPGKPQRGRFYSYVVPPTPAGLEGEDEAGDGDHATPEELEIGRAAVALVLTAERAGGRSPTEMSHTNPGYDVESVGPGGDMRFIEVKGIDGPWGEAGVRLSATQFRFAMEKADAAWLYVVEHARDPGKSRIYRIQDAANAATYFCFDSGWQAIGAVEPHCIVPPVVGDEYAIDDDGEIVTVVEVNAGETFTRLRVRSRDGSERFVVWKPRQANATVDL